jgi:hypothetical protein
VVAEVVDEAADAVEDLGGVLGAHVLGEEVDGVLSELAVEALVVEVEDGVLGEGEDVDGGGGELEGLLADALLQDLLDGDALVGELDDGALAGRRGS